MADSGHFADTTPYNYFPDFFMARVHTHYDNLKVARDAPPEVIRAAYKTLSQKHHPDRNGNSKEAIRIIQLINTAYEVLSDPVKRQEHDEWIRREESGAGAAEPPRQEQTRRPPAYAHRGSHTRRTRTGRSSAWNRFVQQLAALWDRLSRKLTRKVFRKV